MNSDNIKEQAGHRSHLCDNRNFLKKIITLARNIKELSIMQDKADQKSLMKKSGELIAEIFDDDIQTSDTETSIEINFAVLKFKHTIKKKSK